MGYFRIFYYITYILNFILRLIKRHGKAILWFICIAVFLVICLYNPKSNAAYIGDYDYSDSNQAIFSIYDSICMDYLERFDTLRKAQPDNPTIKEIESKMAETGTDYYIFYGDYSTRDGSYVLNASPLSMSRMYIIFFNKDNANWSVSNSLYSDFYNIECDVKTITATRSFDIYWILYGSTSPTAVGTYPQSIGDKINIPYPLFHYHNKYIFEYYYNNISLEELHLIYEMNEKLSSVDETLQQQQEYLEQEPSSEDFSTEDLPTDSGVTATTDSGLNSFFQTFYNSFVAQPNYAQHTIKVEVPFTR